MIAKVITWGPDQVALRMEWAVTTMAETTTQHTGADERQDRHCRCPRSSTTSPASGS